MSTEKENLWNGCLVIAEVAQAHDGSLGIAHSYIDAIANAGADAVKFQTHIAASESTLDEPWRVRFSYQDENRFNYWKRMEFTEAQWIGLAEHAKERGLIFISSPFSQDAVRILNKLDMPFWKIPSGEIRNLEMMESIWETRKPILFSTGMCSLTELDEVVKKTDSYGIPFGIFQCTSEYPCHPKRWGLNMIKELKERYDCPVGLSDHSGTINAGLAAAALGATLIEAHITFSRSMFGPDTPASITIEDLKYLVNGVKDIDMAINSPINKEEMAAEKKDMRNIFGRSWALKESLPAGTIITRSHLTLKKPGLGIPCERLEEILGKKLLFTKSCDRLLSRDDFI